MEEKSEKPVVAENPNKEDEKKVEQKKEDGGDYSQGMSIGSFVNQDLMKQLLDCGFSKTVGEKALYLTGNNSVDKAMDWIAEHQEDPDFEEELRIVG